MTVIEGDLSVMAFLHICVWWCLWGLVCESRDFVYVAAVFMEQLVSFVEIVE